MFIIFLKSDFYAGILSSIEIYSAAAFSVGILLIISACSRHFRRETESFQFSALLVKVGVGHAHNDNAVIPRSCGTPKGRTNTPV
jgi:hypothetical protein